MWPSSFAQTTKTSAIGELVIQILLPVSTKPPSTSLGARAHRAGIGAGVGLGQAEAADCFARSEPRQPARRCSSVP